MSTWAEDAAGKEKEREDSPGRKRLRLMRDNGVSEELIQQWKERAVGTMVQGGVPQEMIRSYFGEPKADLSRMKQEFEKRFSNIPQPPKAPEEGGPQPDQTQIPLAADPKVEVADGFWKALEAGFEMSSSALVFSKPDTILSKDPTFAEQMGSTLGTMVGDIPATVVGGAAGSAAGAFVGGVSGAPFGGLGGALGGASLGGTLGMGAGAMALPTFVRELMMSSYEKGEVKSFADFWERTSEIFMETAKQGAIGAASLGAGKFVGGKLAQQGFSNTAVGVGKTTTEVGVMTSMGAAMEGRIPEPIEFLQAGIVIAGVHTATGIPTAARVTSAKLRNIYAKTGIRPSEVAAEAKVDPKLKQDLLSKDMDMPDKYKPLVKEDAKGEIYGPKPKQTIETIDKDGNPLKMEIEVAEAKPPTFSADLPPSTKEVLSRIAGKKAEAPLKERTAEKAHEVYKDVFNKLHPLARVEKMVNDGKLLEGDASGYKTARMSVAAAAKADFFVDRGAIKWRGTKPIGKGFNEIVGTHKKEFNSFKAYLLSKRAVELEARGIKTGVPLDAAKTELANGKRFEKASKELSNYNNQLLDYFAEAGMLAKKDAKKIKDANNFYIPFYRFFEEGPNGNTVATGIKRIKGSERQIQDPLKSIVGNTYSFVKAAEENLAKRTFIDAVLERQGDLGIVKKVKPEKAPIRASSKEVESYLADQGIDLADEALPGMTIFRPKKRPLKSNEVEIFRDGKREIYEVPQDVADSLSRLAPKQIPLVIRFAASIARLLKAGTTLKPEFGAGNVMRDQFFAAGVSEKFIPLISPLLALKDVGVGRLDTTTLGKKITRTKEGTPRKFAEKSIETWDEFLTSGAPMATFMSMDKYLRTDLAKLHKETGLMDAPRNVIKSPLEALRLMTNISEEMTRLAAFKGAKAAGRSTTEAGFRAREVTVDFQRMGAKMQALNMVTAFLNPALQGKDRLVREFVNPETRKVAAVKFVGNITVPSLLLWWANKDDPRMQEVADFERDNYFIWPMEDWQESTESEARTVADYRVRRENGKVFVDKGVIFKIPKPHEIGIMMGSVPERLAELYYKRNPEALDGFTDTLISTVSVPMAPTALAPAWEQYMNKSTFTGRPIVPEQYAGALGPDQYNEYTSETSKLLGRMLGNQFGLQESQASSPMVMDHYIRAWTGGLGVYTVQLLDAFLEQQGVVSPPPRPSDTLKDVPFIKAFIIRHPSANHPAIGKFYEERNRLSAFKRSYELKKSRAGADNGVDLKRFSNDPDNMYNIQKVNILDKLYKGLSAQARSVRQIMAAKEMTREDKRQKIDSLYIGMIRIAQSGLKAIELADEKAEEQKRLKREKEGAK